MPAWVAAKFEVWSAVFAVQEGAYTEAELEEARWAYEDECAAAELRAEMAYERHLEDRGWEEARAFEAWEASQGLLSYEDASGMSSEWEDEDRMEFEAAQDAETARAAQVWMRGHSLA